MNYSGKNRRAISFPLGGIGSGCIGLSGYGQLIDWEIFNRPAKGSCNGLSHFAIKADDGTKVWDAKVLHADIDTECMGSFSLHNFGHGSPRSTMMGFPHFKDCIFKGEFPFAQINFIDSSFPGKVTLHAFNPFIPTNEDDSSIPAAFFSIFVENTTDTALHYTIAGSLNNPFAAEEGTNTHFQKDGAHFLHLRDLAHTPDEIAYGDLTLATDAEEISFQEYWFSGRWFDAAGVFWQEFSAFSTLKNRRYPSIKGGEATATLTAGAWLQPGESKEFRFIFSWNIPNNHNYWADRNLTQGVEDEKAQWEPYNQWKNYYSILFADSSVSAAYALKHWDRLLEGTRLYHDALFSSTLPKEVLDAVSATVSVLKSPTVLRLEDGSLYGWEGCNASYGSCEGSCTHVWAYTYALCFLFPRLERSMRDLEWKYTQKPDGGLAFRLMLPLQRQPWAFRPCADGQFATIFKTYREYKICGDEKWLREKWPFVKKALEYAWSHENYDLWDPDVSGILTGRQHHTLDMELFGPNSWLQSMYLAALKACAEMAALLGEKESARQYAKMFENGKAWAEEHLFNGEYFYQKIDITDQSLLEKYADGASMLGGSVTDDYWSEELGEIKYQIGQGCAIDQVLGQWHANLIGLGEIFDRKKIRAALNAIYRYNYKPNMRKHVNPCRVYCINDESGTVICSFPSGKQKPMIPVPYSEETMHGFEYQAAAHMIQEGMLKKGLALVRGIRRRYDGARRNPWNEIECGSNYARSMAAFSLLPAFSGMQYNAAQGLLSFAPVQKTDDFRCFWSLDSGFGTVEITKDTASLHVLYGKLSLSQTGFGKKKPPVRILLDNQRIPFTAKNSCIFIDAVLLKAGQKIVISF